MKIFKFLFSGWLMAILLAVFAYVIGWATFIENDNGAVAARMVVYNSRWFELLLLLMVVNFTGMIFTKRLYMKGKLNILAIHVALIIIIIGAGVTRYFGYEGMMHIRNGQTTDLVRSANTYMQIQLTSGENTQLFDEKVLLAQNFTNLSSNTYNWNGKPIDVEIVKFYPKAKQVFVPGVVGESYVSLVLGTKTGRKDLNLREGESKEAGGLNFSFGDTTKINSIQIIKHEDSLMIKFPESLTVNPVNMGEGMSTTLNPGFNPVAKMSMFRIGDISFVLKDFIQNGQMQYKPVTEEEEPGIPVVLVRINENEIMVPQGKQHTIMLDDTEVTFSVGPRHFQLPFSLKLNKFRLERYPGSNSPSSYASDIVVIDPDNEVTMPYSIYMNHILNYGGYRFFQSSYDQDEQGTILSVNYDFWGTLISYIGYAILFTTMILSLFIRNNRFHRVTRMLADVHVKRKNLTSAGTVILFLMLSTLNGLAQTMSMEKHADELSRLYVQNNAGRIEPINTLANKVLVKISKKNKYQGMSANEVMLGIISDRERWQNEKIIKVPEESVQGLLGIDGDYASFMDFLDANGQYKINQQVNSAYQKKPAMRSTFDKGIINVDERINVFYMVLNGSMLKIFPIEDHENNKWITPVEFHQMIGHGTEPGDLFENYLNSLVEAKSSNDYKIASSNLAKIVSYQREMGAAVLPSDTKASMEIFYNEKNIFKNLFPVYMILGVLLVGIFFLQTFKPSLEFKVLSKILLVLLLIAFVIQTFGLGLRWYISGHAPWSNGYESMIYISWATVLAGLLFMKRSSVTLGVTSLLAGITLLTAHMSWLNPELTNLVPVLKSYWLTIHVATITASYGFLGLAWLVGLLNLIVMIFRNNKNKIRVNLALKELMLIVELSMSVGLVLLIIGNFLGGIWANESWGRYWGWDPKETWTLVTIVLYALTLHLTLVPSIRSNFTFNFMAVVSFGAVLMTYFGVNYYLSGLHSYAGGDPVPIPTFVYVALIIFAVVSVLAAYNDSRFSKEEP